MKGIWKRAAASLLAASLLCGVWATGGAAQDGGAAAVRSGSADGNLALDARTMVSSVYNNDDAYAGSMLTDGGLGHYSRWATADGTEHWAILELDRVRRVDEVRVYEDITHGQRIQSYEIQYWDGEAWVTAAAGSLDGEALEPVDADSNLRAQLLTTSMEPVEALYFRLYIHTAGAGPAIREIQLFNRSGTDPAAAQSITLDGQPLDGFSPDRLDYVVLVQGDTAPVVACPNGTVQQAASAGDTAAVTVTAGGLSNTYTIQFVKDEGRSMNTVINAEEYSAQSGAGQSSQAPDGAGAGPFQAGGWLLYKDFAFSAEANTFMAVASNGGDAAVTLEVRIDGPEGQKIGELAVQPTGGWDIFVEQYASVEAIEGTHDLYIVSPAETGCIIDTFVLSTYDGTETEEEKDARMAWWREARFGQFIHFGAYANYPFPADFTGYGEWVMGNQRISRTAYEELAVKTFNPENFDAKAIVDLAVATGQKYIVFTSKHHEGFSMFDTNIKGFEPYNIMDYGVYTGEDPILALSQAAKEAGLGFGVYYSIMDWKHPSQSDWGGTMLDKEGYLSDMKAQLRELIQVYGVDQLWFDGEWNDWWTKEDGQALYRYLRTLNPDIIVNNRVGKRGADDGDFGTPEQEIPAGGLDYDWESCITMNDSWGWVEHDTNWKSAEWIVDSLISTASKGGNMLLNIGPDKYGQVPEDCADNMREAGAWIRAHGEAFYGTTASPFTEALSFGAATKKEGKLYLHVQEIPENGKIVLPALENDVYAATLMDTGDEMEINANSQVIVIDMQGVEPDPYDTIIVLDVEGTPTQGSEVYIPENLALGKTATASSVYFDNPDYDASKAVDGLHSYTDEDERNPDGTPVTKDSRWATADGVTEAWLEVDLGEETTFNQAVIEECVSFGQRIGNFSIEYWADGDWQTAYAGREAGESRRVSFPAVTAQRVRLHILDCLPDATGGPSVWEFGLYLDGALSSLQVNGADVPGFSPTVFSYTVSCPAGTTPVVTATPAYLANTCAIQSASVPGRAVVTVTTLDGQTLTYTIQFTDGEPVPPPQVTEVNVTAPATYVIAGGSLQLQAEVLGDADVSQGVTWQVEGNGASIDANGLLTLDSTAAGGPLTITAVSEADPQVSGQMVITACPRGDLDKDGELTIADVMAACRVLARKTAGQHPSDEEMALGNLDGDEIFTIADVMAMCRLLAQKG